MKKIFTVIISLLLIYCSKGGDASTENLSLSTPVSSNTNANSSNDSSDTNETTDTEQTSDSDESSTNDQTSSTEESANTSEVKILDISGGCTKFIGNGPKGEWFNFVEGSQEEAHAHFIYTANDGGIIQVGETGFLDNNTAKILVAKTDGIGNLLWKKEFGDPGHNLGNSIIEVSDGYIITGAINKDSFIVKLDKLDGKTIWSKTNDNGGMDAIEHIVETPSGLVGIGYVNATDENNTFYTEGEGYITFFDSDGNKTSGRIIDPQMSQAYRIYRINNNLIISGLTPGAEDYALMKTNLNGEKDWIKIYGGDNKDHCFAMDISSDNSIYLSGHTLSNVDNWDSYTMKIDLDGNKLWEKKRGNPRGFDPKYIHDEVWDLKATSDGGCIIVAGTGDEYAYEGTCSQSKDISNVWQVYLIKFSASGEIEWDKTYAPEGGADWAGEAIDLSADGGALIAVDNSQFGILKISSIYK
jgi:hypothetical protein